VPYTSEKPRLTTSIEDLKSRIVGWGVDLAPENRPAVPKEKYNPGGTGAHWELPERQIERYPRERSIEHAFLTPVFGTTCPPRGLSGLIRRYAYRFSEGRTLHWTLLMLADRVDVVENRVLSLAQGRPDNIITETGVLAEFRRHGVRSRLGKHRADLVHQPLDLLRIALPGALAIGALYMLSRGRQRQTDGAGRHHRWRGEEHERAERPARPSPAEDGRARRPSRVHESPFGHPAHP
jgi:hypothetical protein